MSQEVEIIPPGQPVPVPEVVTGSLILRGHGYETLVTQTAAEQKRIIVEASRKVVAVTDSASCDLAQSRIKSLASIRTAVEKSRKDIKAPVIELGRRIDATATEFVAEVITEESRLSGLVADYVREEQRKAREAREAAERERQRIEREEHEKRMEALRAEQEAERQRMAAERAAHEAEMAALAAQRQQDAAAQRAAEQAASAARQAQEEARQRAEAAQREQERAAEEARRQAEAVTTTAPVEVAGVSNEIDFRVVDAAAFYAAFSAKCPEFFEIVVKRAPVLEALKKSLKAKGKIPAVPGLEVFENVKVRGRR